MTPRGRLLVVGATGLVGSALVRRALDDSWDVTATVRDPQAAARVPDALEGARMAALPDALDGEGVGGVLHESRPQVVVNCVSINPTAGRGVPRAYADGNVTSVAVLLDACVREGVPRAILLGSGSEYAPAEQPLDEDAPIGPTTLYGATKAAASVVASYFRGSAGLDLCVARPFSLYGPRERPRMFVGYVIASALAGRPIEMSAGTQRRDYLYVEDLADGLLRLARCDGPLPETLNFSGPQVHALVDVARLAIEISGSASELRAGARPANPGDRPALLGDSRRARELLDWRPSHDLREGLTRTIEWYRANPTLWATP